MRRGIARRDGKRAPLWLFAPGPIRTVSRHWEQQLLRAEGAGNCEGAGTPELGTATDRRGERGGTARPRSTTLRVVPRAPVHRPSPSTTQKALLWRQHRRLRRTAARRSRVLSVLRALRDNQLSSAVVVQQFAKPRRCYAPPGEMSCTSIHGDVAIRSTRRSTTPPLDDVPCTSPPTSSSSTRPAFVCTLPRTYDCLRVTSPRLVSTFTAPESLKRCTAPKSVVPETYPSMPSISTCPPAEVSRMLVWVGTSTWICRSAGVPCRRVRPVRTSIPLRISETETMQSTQRVPRSVTCTRTTFDALPTMRTLPPASRLSATPAKLAAAIVVSNGIALGAGTE